MSRAIAEWVEAIKVTGVIPDIWNTDQRVATHKKEAKSDPSNYRGVAEM
jgi:hypothetical protein